MIKMKHKIIFFGLVLILLLTACETIDKYKGKTSKRIAQEALIYELEHCNSKFTSSSSSSQNVELSEAYCSKVLSLMQKLMEGGYFEDSEKVQQLIITTKTNQKNILDVTNTTDNLNEIASDIIGDI
jgi:hypothetical protein